jgi:hypothetical protein
MQRHRPSNKENIMEHHSLNTEKEFEVVLYEAPRRQVEQIFVSVYRHLGKI